MENTPTAPSARDLDEKRIREFVARSQQAQSDPDVLPALHTPDMVIINFHGRRLFGRETFAAAMTEALSSPLKDIRTELEVNDIRFTTPDVAVVSLTKTVHDERADAPDTAPLTGAMTYVLVRAGDDWRIALAQTTPVH